MKTNTLRAVCSICWTVVFLGLVGCVVHADRQATSLKRTCIENGGTWLLTDRCELTPMGEQG